MDFSQLVDDFRTSYMPVLALPTQAKYASLLRVHVEPRFAAMKVGDINTRKIDEWLAGKSRDGLSWATRADLRNLVSSIFTRAEAWGTYEGKNPATRANPGRRRPVYEKRKLSVLQTQLLLAALPRDLLTVCMIALSCGCRISEVLGLTWKHIDFERGLLLIRQRYWRGDLDRTKSDAADRDIPYGLLDSVLKKLYPGPHAAERFCFEIRTQRGSGVTRDDRSIRRYFLRPAAEKLGIYYRGFGFHAFRREAITAIAGSAGAIQASRIAGHSRMDVTLLYGLDDYEEQRRAIESIQEKFMTPEMLGEGAK